METNALFLSSGPEANERTEGSFMEAKEVLLVFVGQVAVNTLLP